MPRGFARLALAAAVAGVAVAGAGAAEPSSDAPAASEPAASAPARLRVYIGTNTGGKSRGVYLAELDLATGALTAPVLAAATNNPSFVALHPSGNYLYSVGETAEYQGQKTGAISAFAIAKSTGLLEPINRQSSRGAGPCHVVVDATGKYVLAANYGGGSVVALPVRSDGGLDEATGFAQHVGSSVHPGRQKGPHAHSINLDPQNKFAFAADLGIDQVLIYQLDHASGKLIPHDPPLAKTAAGAGPRHFAFHPTGKFAYVINELASTVTAFRYDAARGALSEIQTITTLPEGYRGDNTTAEVQAHPGGKFLYGSNRGHNSIVAYAIDPESGRLTYVSHQSDDIKTPRNFTVEPTGKYVLVGSQAGDRVVVFRVNAATGALEPTGHKIDVAAPVCIKFLAM